MSKDILDLGYHFLLENVFKYFLKCTKGPDVPGLIRVVSSLGDAPSLQVLPNETKSSALQAASNLGN